MKTIIKIIKKILGYKKIYPTPLLKQVETYFQNKQKAKEESNREEEIARKFEEYLES